MEANTALHDACRKGDPAEVEAELNQGGNPNAVGEDGWLPVHAAAAGGIPQVVEMLMSRAAVDLNAKASLGNPSPTLLANTCAYFDFILFLIQG